MSWQVAKAVHDSALPIRSATRAVLLALADYAQPDGTRVFPRMDTVAARVKLSRRQLARHMSELRKMGVLVVVRPARFHDQAEYKIALDVLCPEPPPERDDGNVMPAENRGDMTCHFCPHDMSFMTERGDINDILNPSESTKEPNISLSRDVSRETLRFLDERIDQDIRVLQMLEDVDFEGEFLALACAATCRAKLSRFVEALRESDD